MAAVVGDQLRVFYRRFKPHIFMVLVHIGYTFLYLLTEVSFNHGMDAHVFVTYRHAIGGVVIFPFACFLERKVRPKLTLALFLEMFLLSLLGVSLTLNMYFASLKYTSATFVTSVVNTVPSLTFIIALALRMETLDVRHPRGMAKVLGTLTCLAGVIVIALYEGAEVQSWKGAPIHIIRSNHVHENWIKGPILAVASCISWSSWYVMQGIVCSGLIIFIQLHCTEQKGPVFVTVFNPLGTVLVGLQAYFLLGARLHMGRIVGAVVVILGLYLVLWGKEGDQCDIKSREKSFLSNDEPKEPKAQRELPSETEVP
ncbi:WAT1-related protein At4g08300-like isoform X3 [Alnus glutinosa]|uniref:WAT1-related protein At4g08300-like isoform X3 n=1 Tax=Alnus glutinosa TaxID=3517 RepID=UPI002D79C9B3|nr:WAT1-related protein At4g08300-like isoform X3 [Alnus glutinosa]